MIGATPRKLDDTTSIATPTNIPTTVPTISLPPTSISLDRHSFRNGIVIWKNTTSGPGQIYTIIGNIELEAYSNFAKIISGDDVFYISWDHIVYIGSEEIQ
jgi:hypothetical protein